MPSQVTVTAKTGPAVQNTAIVVTNIAEINFDLANRVVHIRKTDSLTWQDFDLVGVTTTTFSWSGANATMVIS